MNRYEMDPNKEGKQLLHRWAGQMARTDTDTEASRALRTRGLQWWRNAQTKDRSKRDGVHLPNNLMLEVGSTDYSIRRIQRGKIKQHKSQHRMASNSAERRKMERQRTRIRKDNSGSSSNLKKQKENKKKAAAQFQETHRGFFFLIEKRFCGTRVCDGSPCNGLKAQSMGSRFEAAGPFALPFGSDIRPHSGKKPHSRSNRSNKFHFQRDVNGKVPQQVDRPRLKKEGHAFQNFLTSNVTSGASETIRECESEIEYDTSMERKEACERRQHGRTCLVLAREEHRQYNQAKGEELFKKELGKKASCKVRNVTHAICVCLSSQQAAVLFRRQLRQ